MNVGSQLSNLFYQTRMLDEKLDEFLKRKREDDGAEGAEEKKEKENMPPPKKRKVPKKTMKQKAWDAAQANAKRANQICMSDGDSED